MLQVLQNITDHTQRFTTSTSRETFAGTCVACVTSRGLSEQELLSYRLLGSSFHQQGTGAVEAQGDLWPSAAAPGLRLDRLLPGPAASDVLVVDADSAYHRLEHKRKPTTCTSLATAHLAFLSAGWMLSSQARFLGSQTFSNSTTSPRQRTTSEQWWWSGG